MLNLVFHDEFVITLQRVELGILGPVQVRQYGLPVAIPGAKPRAVLTMLGLHDGSVVAADALIELLWGDEPPRTATKAMQTHISALRRALGDGFVLTEGTGWILSTADVDATRYKSAAQRGRDALAAGDASQAVTCFDEALTLWRGIPELPDGRRGVSEKTRWAEGHAALVEDRADALLATGRAAEIIGELEAAIADSPLRERRWGHLMLALYRAGRQGEALGAYQRLRSLLSEELGVDPGPDLRRLEAAIVSQDVSLELPVSVQLSAVTRAVTFLLTDIEGSTAAWEADADAMAVALARHDEIVEQVVTFRGGRLIKTRGEGDATFSVFDRPSGAAAAAIELQEAMRREPWPLAEPVRIRVALHTGEVEFRDGDYFGRAVNRAARLRSLAVGGQILCSGATAELVIDTLADDVVLADLGLRQLKSLARPEHVFELRIEAEEERAPTVDPPVQRPPLPGVLGGSGPFVGRGRELERLMATWQTTQVAGSHAVLISGEPGVGKTRLAGEWSRRAYEQGAIVVYGRCDEDLGAPYQPFSEALRTLVPSLGTSRLRGLRGIEALIPLVPGVTDVLPELCAPPRADPDTERYALFDAVGALLGVAASSAPVVLVLDDLHWAAKPTLLLLRHLLRFGEHARVQLVGTYRSTDLDRSHPLAAMLADLHRDGAVSRLALGGLDEDDVTAYVAEAGYDDEELGRALASVTGGNPFFLIEALRHVDESGGRWDPTTLPQGVREAVSRRLSRLPEETNAALATAAVVGSRFDLALVERVVGHDLVDAFDESAKAGIVIEEPGGRYRFNHAIVRQSLLAELASVRRMRLHQRIASTLESEPGADDELLAELAYHYFECAWAGNAVKAVDYCRRAADQAMARLAYEGAADLYDKAVHSLDEIDDELPDRDEQRAELLVARCEALLAAGEVVAAKGAVSQLRSTAAQSGRLAAWGACFDAQLSMLTDPEHLDEIEAAVTAAAESLAEFNDAAGEAKAYTVRAGCLAMLGRIGDAETALDQALTAARRAREHRRVNAVLAGAPLAALWGPNPVPRAGGRCLDVVRLLRITTGSPLVEAISTRCQGVLDAFRGRATAGRQLIDSARRSLTELGMRHALLEVDQFAGIVELVAGDAAAAEPLLRRAYNGFRRMRLDADTAETAALLARACLALGRDAEADELCTESEHLAGHALKAAIAWRTTRAHLLARGGAHDEARRIAEEAVSIAERTDLLVDHGDACLTLATVLSAAGDVDGAQSAAQKAVELFELKGAAALAEEARRLVELTPPDGPPGHAAADEPDNECVHALRRLEAALTSKDWDMFERMWAPDVFVESRRKIVGFTQADLPTNDWPLEARRFLDVAGAIRVRMVNVIAVRGAHLALARLESRYDDASPGAPIDELIVLFGSDAEGRIALHVVFDVEDIDAAMAELDAQHARFQHEELSAPAVEPDTSCVRVVRHMESAWRDEAWDEGAQLVAPIVHVENRRKIVDVALGDLSSAEWISEARQYRAPGMARHQSSIVAVRGDLLALTRVHVTTLDESSGAPEDEMLIMYGVDDRGRINLQVTFDVDDLAAALAEMDTLHVHLEPTPERPRLDNAASRVDARFNSLFAERRWEEVAELWADGVHVEDRRRGFRRLTNYDHASGLAEVQAIADLGVQTMTSAVVATRGERLALCRTRFSGRDRRPDAFHTEVLKITEIDGSERCVASLTFDLDDLDAAIAELDARYLAGEAAPHAHTWSILTENIQAFNRHEFPAWTPNLADIDHRKVTSFAPGNQADYVRQTWEQSPDLTIYIEAVNRLTDDGAVITYVANGTSHGDFKAEWRGVALSKMDGDRIDRTERFDDDDLNAALARFDELSRPALRLGNSASKVFGRYIAHFRKRDWAQMAEMLADDVFVDDRRRVVNVGARHGRDAEMANARATAEIGVADVIPSTIATRGDRLVLHGISGSVSDWPENMQDLMIDMVEVDTEGRIAARLSFDPDDLDAAFAELDARYLAGEAAPHADTWSVVAEAYAALDRHEMPVTTPDWVNIDRQRLAIMEPGDAASHRRAAWEVLPDFGIRIVAVNRLTDLGAVVTWFARGTSQQGFEMEEQGVGVVMVQGDLINHFELYDEADLDAALARFDELNRPASHLANAASQMYERFNRYFAERDWDALPELMARDISMDDRRHVVNAGVRRGRDAAMAETQAVADVGTPRMSSTAIAIRGDRLVLLRTRAGGRDPGSFHTDALHIMEIADGCITAYVAFDADDIDAAFAELDARYLAGEAAPHADTWSAILNASQAFNRREMFPTTAGWVTVDHRRVTAFEGNGMSDYVRATWDIAPNVHHRVIAVHRLSGVGAVFTQTESVTAREEFEAEWHEVVLLTVEDDAINRCEIFDEIDLDAALARFDELSAPAPRLENAATRQVEVVMAAFNRRDPDGMLAAIEADARCDDRRKGFRIESPLDAEFVRGQFAVAASWRLDIDTVAVRDNRLGLSRWVYRDCAEPSQPITVEILVVLECSDNQLIHHATVFDTDDIDAAFALLEERYLAGEAAPHANTWAVITQAYADIASGKVPPMSPDLANIDHRRVTRAAPDNGVAYLHASLALAAGLRLHIESVHRLSDLGAVFTRSSNATTEAGFEAEWRAIDLITVDGDSISRGENFDETDLDTALARFDELSAPARPLENAATRLGAVVEAAFNRRDLDGFVAAFEVDARCDDRRKGLRSETPVDAEFVQGQFVAPASWRLEIDTIAIRGPGLALIHWAYRDYDQEHQPLAVEAVVLVESFDKHLIHEAVVFDADDIDAAFTELEARYTAGEAARHAHAWSVITRSFAAFNNHEHPPTSIEWADRRRLVGSGPGDLTQTVQTAWGMTRNMRARIEAVHRLRDDGAVITHLVYGTSEDGFDFELRFIDVLTIDGDELARCELFGEADLEEALARFDELI